MIEIKLSRGGVENVIHAHFKTISISKEIGIRGESLTFITNTPVKEWDIIEMSEEINDIVQYGGEDITFDNNNFNYNGRDLVFSGVVESVEISNIMGDATEYVVKSNGWKRILDRAVIAKRYIDISSGNIIRDILENYCPDFFEGNIEEGIFVENFPINNLPPTEAIDILAEANGFTWRINSRKELFFEKQTRNSSSLILSEDNNFAKGLTISPNVSEIVNTVIVFGGSFLSNQVQYRSKGDGVMTQFVLPEKPKNISVFVNGVEKTIAPKFGETTPTSEFLVSYNEKYIENGTHAVLSSSDTITVLYQYDVPLRYKYQDLSAVGAMQQLFPETNGEFVKIIEDKNIEDKKVAEERAKAEIEAKGNPILEGDFYTFEKFNTGDILSVDIAGYKREVVITKINSKSIGGGVFQHNVQFATVLFQFEDFLRSLLKKGKLTLNDNVVVENISAFPETLQLQEYFGVNDEKNITRETLKITESLYIDTVVPVFEWCYGNYLNSPTEAKRNGLYNSLARYS